MKETPKQDIDNSSSQPAGAAGDTANAGDPGADSHVDPFEAAYERGQERLNGSEDNNSSDGDQAGGDTDSNLDPDTAGTEQAGGDTDSTPESSATSEAEGDTASGDSVDVDSTPDSTVEAPEHWPNEFKAKFDGLNSEARQVVLDMSTSMQAGFTRKTQDLADLRKGHEGAIDLQGKFVTDPKGVITELARQANVEIFFDRPLPEGEIPDFDNKEDLVKWMANENDRRLDAKLKARDEESDRVFAEKHETETLERDFVETIRSHDDFMDHETAITELMNSTPGLHPEKAYRLATYDALHEQALKAPGLEAEVSRLNQEMKVIKARSTEPGPGFNGDTQVTDEPDDPFEAAYVRAQRKLSAEKSASQA